MNRSNLRDWMSGTKVSAPARLVFLALAVHADRTDHAWPSNPTLVYETGLSESTVRRALRELEAFGDIDPQVRTGTSTLYCLTCNPGHCDPPTPVTVTGGGGQMGPKPRSQRPPKELKDVMKGNGAAPPQHGGAVPTSRPDGATFLPGTGWIS